VEFAASKAMMAIVAWKFVLTPSIAMLVMKSWSTQRMEHYTRLVIEWMIVMATLAVLKTRDNRKLLIMYMILLFMISYLQCIVSLFSYIIVSSYWLCCKIGYKMYLPLMVIEWMIVMATLPVIKTRHNRKLLIMYMILLFMISYLQCIVSLYIWALLRWLAWYRGTVRYHQVWFIVTVD
jgi:hypothetical protein